MRPPLRWLMHEDQITHLGQEYYREDGADSARELIADGPAQEETTMVEANLV